MAWRRYRLFIHCNSKAACAEQKVGRHGCGEIEEGRGRLRVLAARLLGGGTAKRALPLHHLAERRRLGHRRWAVGLLAAVEMLKVGCAVPRVVMRIGELRGGRKAAARGRQARVHAHRQCTSTYVEVRGEVGVGEGLAARPSAAGRQVAGRWRRRCLHRARLAAGRKGAGTLQAGTTAKGVVAVGRNHVQHGVSAGLLVVRAALLKGRVCCKRTSGFVSGFVEKTHWHPPLGTIRPYLCVLRLTCKQLGEIARAVDGVTRET